MTVESTPERDEELHAMWSAETASLRRLLITYGGHASGCRHWEQCSCEWERIAKALSRDGGGK